MMRQAMLLAVLGLGLGACGGRTHLTRSHGQASRAAFANQASNPDAGKTPRPVANLDSQEAESISQAHRRSMAPKGATASQDSGLLLVAPTANQAPAPYVPPPSVPTETAR